MSQGLHAELDCTFLDTKSDSDGRPDELGEDDDNGLQVTKFGDFKHFRPATYRPGKPGLSVLQVHPKFGQNASLCNE